MTGKKVPENQNAPAADTIAASSIRKDHRTVEQLAMDNCKELAVHQVVAEKDQVYTCKICNKEFSSFQALGGHQTCHNRRPPSIPVAVPPVDGGKDEKALGVRASGSFRSKKKRFECSLCDLEFSTGQALGGHMKRHRIGGREAAAAGVAVGEGSGTRSDCSDETTSESSNRVMMLDLNLTPDENCLIDKNAAAFL